MNVLVAGEEWGRVRDAFAARGHRAISCDLKPTRSPGPHYQGDVRNILHYPWDMLVAHPVCRYLTNAGAKHLYRRVDGVWAKEHGREPERWRLMEEAAVFFNLFVNAAHIPKRAIENPIMHGHAVRLVGGRADQYVQPWWFGDPFSKATGLRLYGLPKLAREREKSSYEKITQECWLMSPGPERESLRSRTYLGIARAFAEQWG